jgi:hypothetical protein
METLNLKVEQLSGNEIIIREGQALPPVEPKQISISGDIKTVSTFVSKRNEFDSITANPGLQRINKDRTIVLVDKAAKTITLQLDPESKYGTVVTAKLELNPELTKFYINEQKIFKQKELCDLIKFSGLLFDDYSQYEMLYKAYLTFNAKAYIDMASENDNRSNKSNSYNKKVETNLPTDFIMNVPIFKGQDSKRFRVEICYDVTDGGCSFWFQSVELKERIDADSETILKKELESCSDFVVVWK